MPRGPMKAIRTALAKAFDFGRDRRGSTAVLFAVSMPMLIGSLGVGFEISNWYVIKRGMQNAADAAVLAAASNGGANFDVEAKAVASQFGLTHGVAGVGVTVLNNVACPSGGSTCYSVTITNSVPLYLSPVVGFAGSGGGKQNLVATSIAKIGTIQRPYCLLALGSGGAQTDLIANGAPKANFAGCSVKSNSSARCNGHDLGADFGDAVGTSTGCGKVQTSGVPPSIDPYSGLAANIPADNCAGSYPQIPSASVVTWLGVKNLSGNVMICGDLKLTGNVSVNAPSGAVLVIQNGRLNTNGYRLETTPGSGLTIVFTGTVGGSYIHAPTGGGTIDVAAPTSGVWSGVMMYQDPKLTTGVDITEAGSSPTWNITGLVYLPNSNITLSGAINKSANGGNCFVVVADTIVINGAADISPKGGCAAAGLTMPTGAVPGRGALVY